MANVWIFQGNPTVFRIEPYLATYPDNCTWQANQNRDEIAVGDRVYIWKSDGDEKGTGGVIAEAIVSGPVMLREEDERSLPFWVDPSKARGKQPRALLDIVRIANKKQVLKREWLRDDPVLKDLPIIKMAQSTNSPVPIAMRARLAKMWAVTGEDWTEDESLAGLWAYVVTLGQSVSQLPSSPVAQVSELTGRAVSGVYNKVMNFRAIDPNDVRTGMRGSSETDRAVWARYFDSGRSALDVARITADFEARWGADGAARQADAVFVAPDQLVRDDLEALMAAYRRRLETGRSTRGAPSKKVQEVTVYDRDPFVIAIAKQRANYMCEVPNCETPSFIDESGRRYCEVHHIDTLGGGGADTIDNAACLCAMHHREIHFGVRAKELREQLRALRLGAGNAT